ncbi:MAG: hypothetical protein AB7V62_18120 [Thermoleophilia bacterium]
MARPGRRAIVAALVALIAALALAAGCGGGDDGGEDLTGGLTPQELLDRSAEEAAGVETFRIAFEAAGSADLDDPGAIPGGELIAGDLDISGEGPVQNPDRASIDLTIGLAGPSLQGNLTRVGDEVFLGVLGQDFRVDLPPEQVALLDFSQLYPTLAGWATDPQETAREEIDGVSTVKITAGIDPEAALGDLAPLLGTGEITPAQAAAAVRQGSLEMWIGTGDLLPRRVHLVLQADGTGLDAGVGAVDIDLTADLSAYGEPVDIQAPQDAQELDLEQLGGLTGG